MLAGATCCALAGRILIGSISPPTAGFFIPDHTTDVDRHADLSRIAWAQISPLGPGKFPNNYGSTGLADGCITGIYSMNSHKMDAG